MMRVYARQLTTRFLLATEGDPETPQGRGLLVETGARTVQKIASLQNVLRRGRWKLARPSDPSVDDLVSLVPALRRYRGIQIRLPDDVTAWINRKQWDCPSPEAQARLEAATVGLTVPPYTPDADCFLASAAVAALGGEVLDRPRAAEPAGPDAY